MQSTSRPYAGLESRLPGEISQAGIKIAGRNINKLKYTDDTTLMAESEEELKKLEIELPYEWCHLHILVFFLHILGY